MKNGFIAMAVAKSITYRVEKQMELLRMMHLPVLTVLNRQFMQTTAFVVKLFMGYVLLSYLYLLGMFASSSDSQQF